MKRKWVKRREFVPQADGEQRWDRAYQYLLQWAKEMEAHPQMSSDHLTHPKQEVDDERSDVCAGLHTKSG